jgi:hypothetical protein
MRYDEKTELEATGEWLLRMEGAGFSDELLFVPSELFKRGVAPIDVVDRLDYLKGEDHGPDTVDHVILEAAPEDEEESIDEPVAEELEAAAETLDERPASPVDELTSLIFDYDSYGAWEWVEPIEKMIEEAFSAVLDQVPGLHEFNDLAALTRSRKRSRGKRARAASAARTPDQPVYELVGNDSVGATA